jgi:tetratricopeptide (TPR) repeat protein
MDSLGRHRAARVEFGQIRTARVGARQRVQRDVADWTRDASTVVPVCRMSDADVRGSVTTPVDTFAALPDPARANSIDDLVERLRLLKVWAGNPSYEVIKDRVNSSWAAAGRPAGELVVRSTVAYCFRPGRRRLDTDLVLAVVHALHPDSWYVTQWRQALRVVGGETEAASLVRVQDSLPPDLADFTGRTSELDQLRRAARAGDAVVISAIEGMAGVGKTELAVHAGHVLSQERPFQRVLFVNLRGFDPDPAQPPVDPAAVLDGFLRLLGVPGHQIPHDLAARTAAYRDRLAGTRTMVVLDNAVTAEQVGPLLPATPGCLTIVTSRRSLDGLHPATRLTVDVFTPDEAVAFLSRALPTVPVGADPHAANRIAWRCGYLPLALGLVAGRIRSTPGWTLTDHADRLDERHHDRRLDSGVELALTLSYRHLPAEQQRLLRLAALHPGRDLDAYAAAALVGTDVTTARAQLDRLHCDHLMQQSAPGRYAFHDLVRAYAITRARDDDRFAERRTVLTRLFDHYLATAAAAMDLIFPAGAPYRPRLPSPTVPVTDLAGADAARAWLDTERPNLLAVTEHAATHGWPTHAIHMSGTLYRYLDGGHHTDALAIHGHALHAARSVDDLAGQATAHKNLGTAYGRTGQFPQAREHFNRAAKLYRQIGDQEGEARALSSIGVVEERLGRLHSAYDHHQQALAVAQRYGYPTEIVLTLSNVGQIELQLRRYREAVEHLQQALGLARQHGDGRGEACASLNLGDAEIQLERYDVADHHIRHAMTIFHRQGNHAGEAWALNSLGSVHLRLHQPDQAAAHHRRALDMFRDMGDLDGEPWALNALGETAQHAGRHREAIDHHDAALIIATNTGAVDQQARAHAGLGHAHHALANSARAREHYQRALALYSELDRPEADQLRIRLATTADHPTRT